MSNTLKLNSLITWAIMCMSPIGCLAQSSAEFHKLGDKKDSIGNFRSAVKLYEKALVLDPNNTEILEKLVYAKSNMSKYKSAISNLNSLIMLKPESSKFYFFRGFANFRLKNYKSAVLDYSKAIEVQEDKISNLSIYSERGICKMYLNDFKGAISDFNKILTKYTNKEIAKLKKEAEIKLKENPPSPKYRAVQTNVHHIILKKPVLTSN